MPWGAVIGGMPGRAPCPCGILRGLEPFLTQWLTIRRYPFANPGTAWYLERLSAAPRGSFVVWCVLTGATGTSPASYPRASLSAGTLSTPLRKSSVSNCV